MSEIIAGKSLARPQASATIASACVFTRQAPNKNSGNEDSLGAWSLAEDEVVLAVADGIGGCPGGAQASLLAVTHVGECLRKATAEISLRTRILDGFEAANASILDLRIGAGTTLIVVEVSGGVVRSYHAGDSGALVVGQRGRVKLETIPHSPSGYSVAAGETDPDAVHLHEDRSIISNCVGSPEMRVEIGAAVALARYDTVLVASDGVLDNVRRTDLIDLVRVGSGEAVAQRLVERISSTMESGDGDLAGNPDDASFVLYRQRAS